MIFRTYFISLIDLTSPVHKRYTCGKVALDDARKCSESGNWAIVPYGGAGGDIDGLLMAGMNVVAIERNEYMISAIKARANAIMARLEDGNFEFNAWLEKLEKSDVDFPGNGDGDEEDNNGSAGDEDL